MIGRLLLLFLLLAVVAFFVYVLFKPALDRLGFELRQKYKEYQKSMYKPMVEQEKKRQETQKKKTRGR